MSALNSTEIDELAGVSSDKQKLSTPLLTSDQKSDMLNPPTPFYAKSPAQALIVAGVVVPLGWLLYTLFSGGGGEEAKTAKLTTTDNEKQLVKQLEDERQARINSDKNAAFGNQNRNAAMPVVVKPGVKVPGKPKAPVAQNVSAVPIVTRSYTPPVPQRIYQNTPTVIPIRRSYVQPSSSNPVAFAPSIPKEDPQQAWKRLSELGSFGESNSSSTVSAAPSPYTPAVYTQPNNGSNNNVIEAEYTPSPDTQPTNSNNSSPSVPSTGISIPAGTEARGELSTPVLWAQDINISEDEFLVKLTKPLGTALPTGALVIVKPDKLSSAGLIRFKAVRATVNGEDKTLPEGIQVVSSDGGFIKAEQKRPGSGFNFSDVFSVFLGGAKTATAIINQPATSSSFSSTGGISQTVTNSQPSVLAAFGQGAADSMLTRAQSRVQQVQTTRSPYFLIGTGTSVKLVVTQTISM